MGKHDVYNQYAARQCNVRVHSQRRELWVNEESTLFILSPYVLKV